MNPEKFDIVGHDLKRHLKHLEMEEMMFKNVMEITVYNQDYGWGRIVIHTIDGPTYHDDDIEAAVEEVREFITERMGNE